MGRVSFRAWDSAKVTLTERSTGGSIRVITVLTQPDTTLSLSLFLTLSLTLSLALTLTLTRTQ